MLLVVEEARNPGNERDPIFLHDVLTGLNSAHKAIPARWFYDRRGSELFEDITATSEYYPTRVERTLLERHAPEVASLAGPARAVVEFGAGSTVKTPTLLLAVAPAAYVPIDISGEFLELSVADLAAQFPGLPIFPLVGDFASHLRLPGVIAEVGRLGFFPGSTVGNFSPAAAADLLRAFAQILGEGAMLLIGMDRVKDQGVLESAYDDAEGVTAAFNLNLLSRINRELGGTIPLAQFRHDARWNERESRMEMHLVAVCDVQFEVAGRQFGLLAGESIHTENSYKFTRESAQLLLATAGWSTIRHWSDEHEQFGLLLAEARKAPDAP